MKHTAYNNLLRKNKPDCPSPTTDFLVSEPNVTSCKVPNRCPVKTLYQAQVRPKCRQDFWGKSLRVEILNVLLHFQMSWKSEASEPRVLCVRSTDRWKSMENSVETWQHCIEALGHLGHYSLDMFILANNAARCDQRSKCNGLRFEILDVLLQLNILVILSSCLHQKYGLSPSKNKSGCEHKGSNPHVQYKET